MITNKRIIDEILTRKKAAFDELNQMNLPPVLMSVWETFKTLDDTEMIRQMSEDLLPNFSIADKYQFLGFEWYYDGGGLPMVTGYVGKGCVPSDEAEGIPVGSNTSEAREDFEIITMGDILDTDTGEFEMSIVCGSLYEIICKEREHDSSSGEERNYQVEDMLINIYDLKLFEILHLSMERLVSEGTFESRDIKKPFYIFANNHDWNPFLVYCID